ncbi:MAG: histidine kinase dimerization/phospho-acceptor domain-containing protein, partial [Polyangiales bacterium]
MSARGEAMWWSALLGLASVCAMWALAVWDAGREATTAEDRTAFLLRQVLETRVTEAPLDEADPSFDARGAAESLSATFDRWGESPFPAAAFHVRAVRGADEGAGAARGHTRVLRTFRDGHGAWRVVAEFTPPDLGAVHVRFGSVAGVVLVLALLVGAWLGGRIDRGLEELRVAAERVGRGELHRDAPSTADEKPSRAMNTFDGMVRELERTQQKLLRAERLAAWREIAQRIAHEIKNPLSPIQLSIETLRKTRAQRNPAFDEIFDESTRTVLEEVERLRRIVSEFSEFARMPRPQPSDVDVREVVEHVVRLVQPDGPDPEVRLEGDRSRVVRADRGQLVQVFMNLVKNGLEAARQMRGAGSAAVVIRIEPHVDGVTVHVDDNGVGIP